MKTRTSQGITLVALLLALSCLLSYATLAHAQTALGGSVRSTIVPLNNSTTEIDIDFINEIPRAMMWVMVQATNVSGVGGTRPAIVDVALLFYPLNSLNSSATLVMSAPMTFENNNNRFIRQTFATCSSVYAATLNRFVDVGTKLGRWTAVISRAQNAFQLSAVLNVTIGAMTGQLSQSQTEYTGLVPSAITFFDIANPSANPQNLAVSITATQGNLSWLQLVSFRPQTCPVYTPFGIPDVSQVNVPLKTNNVTVTVLFANVTGDWHIAFESDGSSGQPFMISYTSTDVIPPVVYEPFWDTENIVLAVLFGIGVLVMVVGLSVAIYWYNVRFSKREDYESL